MQPLSPQELKGLWAPILPTIAADESLALDALERSVERYLSAGVSGIDDGGTRCENAALSEEERESIANTVAEACRAAGTPFVLGVGTDDHELALERIRRARDREPDAISVVLPNTIKPEEPEFLKILSDYCEAAAPFGIVLDHPPHIRLEFPPELCAPIREAAAGVIGIRVGLGTEEWYERWRQAASDLSVFVPGHHHATGISRGANGSCSNFASMSPTGAVSLHKRSEESIDEALDLEAQLQCFLISNVLPLQIEEGYSSTALDKLLAAAGGWFDGSARLRGPEAWVDDGRVQEVRAAALQELAWFFENEASESQERAA